MNAPAITQEDILAIVGAVLGLLLSQSFIDEALAKAITSIAASVLAVVFIVAASYRRGKRAEAIGNGAKVADGKLVAK